MTGTLNAGTLGNYGQAVLDDGPTGYWRLESTAGTTAADTANAAGAPQDGAQDGTYQNLVAGERGQPGPRPTDLIDGNPLLGFAADNNAVNFQGDIGDDDGVVLVPATAPIEDLGASALGYSIEAWVKADSQLPGDGWDGHGIVTKGTGNGGEMFCLDVVGGGYRLYGWGPGGTPLQYCPTSVLPNGNWQHVVATIVPGGDMNFYVNGVNVASAPGAAVDPQMSNNHEVSIGSRRSMVTEQNPDPAYDLSFVGLIDEVALYDHALSAADVEAHFAAAFVPIPEPSTLMMALVGLISLAGFARRRWR